MNKAIIVVLLFFLANSQEMLQLDQSNKLTLKANQPRSFTLSPNSSHPNNTQLFITADPLLQIPNQIPTISLTSSGTNVSCFTATNQMEGVCRIDSAKISKDMNITLSCIEDCVFWLAAYFSYVYAIELDNQYPINHNSATLSIYQLQLQAPDKDFDDLILTLTFSKQTAKQGGAEMYVNIGGTVMPDQKNYKYKAEPQHQAVAVSIPHSALPNGTSVKIAIFTSTIISMKLKANIRTKSVQSLSLGGEKYDIIGVGQSKIYKFQSGDYYKQLADYNIDVALNVYSGHPEISVAFDSKFTQALQNSGVGGKLNYLLTPEIRQQLLFNGSIYVKVQSFNFQSSLQLTVRIVQKEYVYMKEASNYLSFIQQNSLQNYIFDYQTDMPSNTSDDYALHFTVKITMLEGSASFFSRVCSKESSLDCLVDVKGLEDKTFLKQVDDLPGQILHYYSIYEVFQWLKLKQCSKQQLTNTTNRYKCRIHIVGYNSEQQQLTWALTVYSRQNNIQLTEAIPFKDKVYQDTYNYYSFTPPTDQYQEIVIFLTLLTGEAEIISSLNYLQPEHIFSNWDASFKFGLSNQIIYKSQQAKGNINIGVYGDSMAQYLLHVVTTRNKQTSAIALLPQIGQLFRLSTDRESMSFRLSPNKKGDWVVWVSAIQGNTQFLLSKGQKVLCNTTESGNSSCKFVAELDQYILVVYRVSKGESKVVIGYSPAGGCKILPLSSPSFVEMGSNQTECLQYIIHQTPLLVAYSKNILSTFDNNFSVQLYINDHHITTVKQHYHFIALESIQSLCSQNIQPNNDVCKLRVQIKTTQPLDLEITVAAVGGEIPLFGGVVLPFSREDVDKATPLYFYYQVTEDTSFLLNIRSFTYDEYSIEWTLVEQQAYLNSSSTADIYPKIGNGDTKTNSITEYHHNVGIKISSKDNKCENCILLVAIYPLNKVRYSVLQLQILNQQLQLQLGETRKGKIGFQESVIFKLITSQKQSSVLSLSGYQKTDCYTAKLRSLLYTSYQKEVVASETVIEDGQYEVEIIGSAKNQCEFQVSLWNSKYPIRVMSTYYSYSVELKDTSAHYFIYQHTTNTSFKIYEVITSGSLYSYAAPLKGITLQKALETQQFVFGSASPYEDLLIEASNKNFCFNCNYLIKVVGNPSATLLIGVSDPHNPVYLSSSGIVRQKLQKNQSSLYEYVSFESFSIRFNVISGSLKVKVKDLFDKVLYSQILNNDQEIEIQQQQNYFFLIEITAEQQATYILQIVEEQGVKLLDGVPYQYELANYSTFLYTHSTNQPINLVVISEETQKNEQLSDLELTATITTTKKDKKKETRAVAVKQSERSGNIVSFSLVGQPGKYSMVLATPHNVTTKLLITRNQLTYLPLQTEIIGRNSNIYEISTNNRNVMLQVFVCKGSATLQATSTYSQIEEHTKPILQSNSVITLEHNNMAGHYVVNSQSQENQYYVLVNGSSDSVYRVLFDYIGTDLPYKYFYSVDYAVQYELNNGSVSINFQVPQPKDIKKISAVTALFEVAYSQNATDLKIFQQCLTNVVKLSTVRKNIENYPDISTEYQSFLISADDISQIFKESTEKFFVSAKVIINAMIDGQNKMLRYIYEPVEISMSSFDVREQKKEEETKIPILLIWIFLPIVIAGMILVVAVRCCWQYWHLIRSKTFMLEEEQDPNGDDTGPSFEVMHHEKKNRIET